MHQLIRIVTPILFLSLVSAAAPTDMNEIYQQFQKSREQFLGSSISKKEFQQRFQALDTELNLKYKTFRNYEKEELSPKGNQMAYDLELMEPLRNLASSKMTKQDCLEAKHINDLNANDDDKKETDSIFSILKTVCY